MKNVRNALLFLLALTVVGMFGYAWIEGWTLLDGLYMTVITLSTVGFGEIHPLSQTGKLFTSVLIVVGVGTLAYALTRSAEFLLEQGLLHKRRMTREVRRMRDHTIVCGYGRMGRTVVHQLVARKAPVLVIEKDQRKIERIDRLGIPYVFGDATDDETLIEGGVQRAKSLATVLNADADNLFVTLSAHSINPYLNVIARASSEKSEAKMLSAGATRVLNPYRTGGGLMVRQLLHPSVTEFMDAIQQFGDPELCLEEIQIQAGSQLAGHTLDKSPIKREMDVLVVGVRRETEDMIFNPPSTQALDAGDMLLVMGHPQKLRRLEKMAEG